MEWEDKMAIKRRQGLFFQSLYRIKRQLPAGDKATSHPAQVGLTQWAGRLTRLDGRGCRSSAELATGATVSAGCCLFLSRMPPASAGLVTAGEAVPSHTPSTGWEEQNVGASLPSRSLVGALAS